MISHGSWVLLSTKKNLALNHYHKLKSYNDDFMTSNEDLSNLLGPFKTSMNNRNMKEKVYPVKPSPKSPNKYKNLITACSSPHVR